MRTTVVEARGILRISDRISVEPSELEKFLRRLNGVRDVRFNHITQRACIEYNPSIITLEEIRAALAKIEDTPTEARTLGQVGRKRNAIRD